MKVILLHEVPGLGKPGDVKDVADGYARNYLLPRQLVTAATPTELAMLRERVAGAQRRAERQRGESEALAARLQAVTLTFAVRVGRGERLYGSVTSQDLANALLEQEGINIDRRSIQLREPLRQLGTFQIALRVAPQIEPTITVNVVSNAAPVVEGEQAIAASDDTAPAEDGEQAEAADTAEV